MDRNDERIKRALRRRPYVLKPVRVNTPDSVLWPSGKVHRRPKPSTSVQTPQIHKRPPIIVSYGQDQTSGDGWNINPEPLSQSGRVTRLIERKYDDVISSSDSDDFSIYSFTDCESECDDEDHERRTPPLKVEDGKVTKIEVRDMVEDDDLSLHSFDESDFLSPGKVSGPVSVKTGVSPFVTSAHRTLAEALQALPSAVGPPYPENVPRPLTPLSPVIIAPPRTENLSYRHSPRLAPITNLIKTGRVWLQEMAGMAPQVRGNGGRPGLAPITNTGRPLLAPITNLSETGRKLLQEMAGVAPQDVKVSKKKKGKAKKVVKEEKASKMQQVENVGESKEDKKEEKKSLRKRFLQWLLPKLRCSK